MSPPRHTPTLADLLRYSYPPTPPEPRNALFDVAYSAPRNALWDWQLKTEWVAGYWRDVPYGLFGYRREWVPGYWRRG